MYDDREWATEYRVERFLDDAANRVYKYCQWVALVFFVLLSVRACIEVANLQRWCIIGVLGAFVSAGFLFRQARAPIKMFLVAMLWWVVAWIILTSPHGEVLSLMLLLAAHLLLALMWQGKLPKVLVVLTVVLLLAKVAWFASVQEILHKEIWLDALERILAFVVVLSMLTLVVSRFRVGFIKLVHKVALQNQVLEHKIRQRTIEYENARDLAEETNRMQGDFARQLGMSFRDPVQSLLGVLGLLHRTDLNAQQRLWLSQANGSARNLYGLLCNATDLANRADRDRVSQWVEFDPHTWAREWSQSLGEMARAQGLEWKLTVAEDLTGPLLGESARMALVIQNLVSYTMDVSPTGIIRGNITGKNLGLEGHLCLQLSDASLGMTELEWAAFWKRTDPKDLRCQNPAEVSLGLAREWAALLGGSLQGVTIPGRGTQFTVEFPVKIPPVRGRAWMDWLASMRGARTLVVDDQPVVAEILAAYLGEFGFAVDVARSGEEAMHKIAGRKEDYRLLLVDWKMPGIDGLEVCRMARKVLGSELIAFVVTAQPESRLLGMAKESGADGVLAKPIERGALFNSIVEVYQNREGINLEPVPQMSMPRRHVLLVEDNEIHQLVAEELLRQVGCRVTVVASAEDALKLAGLNQAEYDLVLVDYRLSGMDGCVFARLAKKTSFVLWVGMSSDVESLKQAGGEECFDMLLSKPLNLGSVDAMLARLVPQA